PVVGLHRCHLHAARAQRIGDGVEERPPRARIVCVVGRPTRQLQRRGRRRLRRPDAQELHDQHGDERYDEEPPHTGNVPCTRAGQSLTVGPVAKTLRRMPRALALGLTLALLGGPARAQAPSLPTPAPSPSGVASKPSGVATKPSGIASKPSGVAAKPKVATRRRKPKQPPPPPPPAAELFALNTRETFHIRPDKRGRINTQTLRGWNRFLRCHHTGRVHSMSTRLAQLIYEVDKHFGFKRVLVVAGYRAPRIAREKGNPKSPHKKGVACD